VVAKKRKQSLKKTGRDIGIGELKVGILEKRIS